MTKDELIKLLYEYDFLKNSVKKFANEYKISEKTVKKYLKQNNINYNSRTLITNQNRDVKGRFCFQIQNLPETQGKITKPDNIIPQENNFLSYEQKIRRFRTPYTSSTSKV